LRNSETSITAEIRFSTIAVAMTSPAPGSIGTSFCSPPKITTGISGSQTPPGARRIDRDDLLASLQHFFGHDARVMGLAGASFRQDSERLRHRVDGKRECF
jgi:hypothetical protein